MATTTAIFEQINRGSNEPSGTRLYLYDAGGCWFQASAPFSGKIPICHSIYDVPPLWGEQPWPGFWMDKKDLPNLTHIQKHYSVLGFQLRKN